jgi:hypothetical protein
VVMFHGAEMLFELPLIFMNEEYANMHSVYDSSNGHGISVVMEYQWWHPRCRVPYQDITQNVHRILSYNDSFLWPKAEHGILGFGKVMF